MLLQEIIHCARNLHIRQLTALQVTNKSVGALVSKISGRLLTSEKTDSEYSV